MRILYVSVHQILEYDELRLFRDLGHDVFSLGAYFNGGQSGTYRPEIDLGPTNAWLREQYLPLGCSHSLEDGPRLSPEWISLFDVVVVMHNIDFIDKHWEQLSVRPVILRLIGQLIEIIEPRAAKYLRLGLHIVRYSPVEMLSDGYSGNGDLIRFYKRVEEHGPWTGGDGRVLTFVNNFQARFPEEFEQYSRIVDGLHPALGGSGNNAFCGNVGMVSLDEQRALLRGCAAYLCCSTRDVPYTLAFVEAWITGIPVIVLDAGYNRSRYFELPSLIEDGVTGFVCGSVAGARAAVQHLQNDPEYARRIGEAGQKEAVRHFGFDDIAAQWQRLLGKVVHSTARA